MSYEYNNAWTDDFGPRNEQAKETASASEEEIAALRSQVKELTAQNENLRAENTSLTRERDEANARIEAAFIFADDPAIVRQQIELYLQCGRGP